MRARTIVGTLLALGAITALVAVARERAFARAEAEFERTYPPR